MSYAEHLFLLIKKILVYVVGRLRLILSCQRKHIFVSSKFSHQIPLSGSSMSRLCHEKKGGSQNNFVIIMVGGNAYCCCFRPKTKVQVHVFSFLLLIDI